MAELGSDEYPEEVNIRGYKPNTKPHHGQILRAMNMIYDAKRPLFLIGGGAKIAGAQEEMCKLMETLKVPVVTTIMGRGSYQQIMNYIMEILECMEIMRQIRQ